MTTDNLEALAAALQPLISRVRTDVTAIKRDSGRQAWTREPLTSERLARHLNGGPARGVSQIAAGSSSTLVGLLDFDSHGSETPWPAMLAAAVNVMQSIELMGGSPIAFRSSGGRGVHVYCLWADPQDAYSVRAWLTDALTSCGYKNGAGRGGVGTGFVEVFPKQDEVAADGFGNQAILPLSGASVPIVWEELAGGWVVGERSEVLRLEWPMSDPVPVREKPLRSERAPVDLAGLDELVKLLAAIPNRGPDELDYDDWRDCIFILHHETEGSGAGLMLAHEFSARSSKYDADFLDTRVWPYIRSEGRERVKGLGSLMRIASRFGWHEAISDEGFDDISAQDNRPPVAAVVWVGIAPGKPGSERTVEIDIENGVITDLREVGPGTQAGERGQSPPPSRVLPKVQRRGIPEAHYLTTDQANAQRLKNSFGSMVFVSAGKWHVWDGKRWVADESDVYRYACRLSDIVRDEARPFAAKASEADARGDTAEAKQMKGIAEALGKWALRCEMKGTIEAAIGLARKMLTVESDVLDRDPWALNCENGTVDLRTGELRRHDPAEYITKLVPIKYEKEAACPTWERALLEIVGGRTPVAEYLCRWFGYCLTGKTTEQAFVVHWGPGGNGKSVVLEMMSETMGDYAGTAAPGLLVASKGSERHPTEIAALFGKRMVTAHESGEGVVLREDFVKQATGGDKLTARYMREDFFEFSPTHKIQLLTNHKPAVKGQDAGIWRRVQLVPYGVRFGSVEQVQAGTHDVVRDLDLMERLRAELSGVLAWRVRGAVEWVQRGLDAPALVRAASDAYKSEQDRIGQFVGECCEVGAEFEEALTDAMGGLYPAYQSWCKDGGVFALSKQRFVDDVLRVVPVGGVTDRKVSVAGGNRRKVKILRGLRLLGD